MSKRHFNALAAELARVRRTLNGPDAMRAWRRCVDAVADACAGANPQFNRSRFVGACEYDPPPVDRPKDRG